LDGPEPSAPENGDDRTQGQIAIVKPRVLFLLVFSGLTGFLLATTQADATWEMAFWLLAGGVMATASANIFNNILDRDRDSLMERTMWRPIPTGAITSREAAYLGAVLGFAGLAVIYTQLNSITAALTLAGMLYYIIVYTMVLKPLTVENITIGGVAGAFPPLVGWTAVTGQIDWLPLYLGLLVILWTPPHFWSLALFHQEDYKRAGVPMLPVVKGERETRRRIAGYTMALVAASILLFIFWNEMGIVYLGGIIAINVPMFVLVARLLDREDMASARALFVYSNVYLLLLFVLITVDAVVLGTMF